MNATQPTLAGFALPALATTLLADASDLTALGQYGAIGIFAMFGGVFAKRAYDREATRADRLEGELLKLHATIADKVIPALESSARTMTEMAQLSREADLDRRSKRAGER